MQFKAMGSGNYASPCTVDEKHVHLCTVVVFDCLMLLPCVTSYHQSATTSSVAKYTYTVCGVFMFVQWRRNVSQWDGSSRPTFKSGTAGNAFCRPTFWPQTAY